MRLCRANSLGFKLVECTTLDFERIVVRLWDRHVPGMGSGARQPGTFHGEVWSFAQDSTLASIVMFAFRSREMGQPDLAASATDRTWARSAPGTFAATSRCDWVTAKPLSTFSSVTVAVVRMDSGVTPTFPSSAEKAIEKQPACAAAINSSGLVPAPDSNRVQNEYWVSLSTPLSLEIVPLPSFKLPSHTADALRFMFALS
jgi:hypothetical protein